VRAAAGIAPAIAIDRSAPAPLHRQVCDGFREAIVEGRLRAGQRVPSTRSLAAALGISRIPVLTAFDQLLAEGYFESAVGAGTFVSRTLPAGTRAPQPVPSPAAMQPARRPVAKGVGAIVRRDPEPWLGGFGAFRVSEPALDLFPFAAWSRLVARHSRRLPRRLMKYGSPMGDLPLRQALASYLGTARAVRCAPEQIMVVSGSQQALEIAARVLLDPGQAVWVEEPGYGGARDALTLAGARLVPVPVDGEGLDVAAGIRTARRARCALVTPSHQYPLGATMSASRRLQLLDWAEATGAWIIEDDYDSEYRYDSQPVAALQGLDRTARVVYIGTFSKVLFPALRVGYLVIPPDLVDRFAAVREAMDIFPPTLLPAVLADFIVEGHFARHLRRTNLLYRERRSMLVETLRTLGSRWRVVGAEAGIHLVALCDRRDRPIAVRAARDGLWAMPLSSCHLGPPRHQGLVLGYGGTDVTEIPEAVARLRKVIAST
jgi:GntR family transcriptional regulator/MocR family aminotransferase